MISVTEAQKIVLDHTKPLGLEKADLLNALGRVIGEDIVAPFNVPPWDNSAMDGYAVRFTDIRSASPDRPVSLAVVEYLRAGSMPQQSVGTGQATRIMTGAPLPEGVDTVVRQEDTGAAGDEVRILVPPAQGDNIRRAGENVRKGDLAILQGTRLRPPHIGMLASFSKSYVSVFQKPRVAILSTGDEIAEVDEERDPTKIANSNMYSIASQVMECGALPLMLGIARDTKEDLVTKLRYAFSADVILTTGGVSVGEYDYVKEVMEDMGVEIKFSKVAMRPGRPSTFGILGSKLLFGLPGNPVSCMVCFEQFVRPSLLKAMGHRHLFRPLRPAALAEEVNTKKNLRYFLRVRVYSRAGVLHATTTGDQGSGILKSMLQANGLMIVPEGRDTIKAGEQLPVQILDPSFELED